MKRIAWTPERTAELLALSATMPHKAVAAKLGLTLSQVENRVTRAKSEIAVERNEAPAFRSEPLLAAQPSQGSLPKAPAVHTSKSRAEAYLVVPDLQTPFHAPDALEFCERVRREFAIPKENVLLTGDEVDSFHGKGLDKARDPDAEHTPRQELAAAVDELKRWYATYPNVRVAISNHGTRYERRAAEAEISSQWMRLYREVIGAPDGWVWKSRWLIPATKHPFLLEHGHEGASRTEAKVLENGYSTVHGHFTKMQIIRVTNHLERSLWGFCAAALIDFETYAFKYAKRYPRRADNGVGVILDGGKIPLWVPHQ